MLPYINSAFAYAADALGASVDELKLIFAFILSYPLCGILKRIPDAKPYRKNLFIIAVSILYLVGLFDLWDGLRTLIISSAGAYAIAYYLEGPFMPWIAFVFLMGHMSINHLHRQFIGDPRRVDITGAQMVLVMKLTAFCWNVHDGRLPEKDLSDFQKERALRQLPFLLDYAGYVLFFPALFAGPAFDYVEYRRWIETSMFELPPDVDPSKAPRTRKKRKIPRSGTPATIKAVIGGLWIFAFLKFSGWYPPSLLTGHNYMKYGFLRRIWLLYMVGFAARMKYYGVWSLTEGACILSGIGYKGVDPKTGRVNWDRLQNVRPLGIELAQNTHDYLGNWNINTNHWLRNYMYLRVTPRGKKPGFRASMATFITSAFWHGFYPGYYMAFMLAGFLQTCAKNCRRYIRPFFLTPDGKPTAMKPYYDFASWLATQLAISFTVAPFILLSFQASVTAWARVYFYTIVGAAILLAFFASPGKVWLIQALKKRTAAATTQGNRLDERRGKSPTEAKEENAYQPPTLGLPNDPGRDLDEIFEEVRNEIETRRRRGQSVDLSLEGVKKAVEQRLGDGVVGGKSS